jgi:DNA-directed RNA polymerase specialized sigma24 family protein
MSAARQAKAARFPTTRWSLVDLVRRGDAQATREALDELLTRYLPALQAHLVRRRGLPPHEADDLIQEFVAGKILEKGLIARADQKLGKFRTLLMTALDRFVIDRARHAAAKKRSPGDAGVLSLGDHQPALPADETPSGIFDVTWARGVLAETLQRMRQRCDAQGRDDLWGVFESRLADPILTGSEPADYAELVERFGLKSPAHASNVLITAKRMFARTLRAVVAEYCQDEQEVESEIEELREILARGGG